MSINNKSKEKMNEDEIGKDKYRVATALASSETVSRFGSANAEFIKGYSGIDHETGKVFDRSLKKIFGYKVNSDQNEAVKNIKQQSGFSAEVAATSRDNAKNIIGGSKVRVSRSEDLSQYGKNHTVVDRVQILDGKVISGSESQMKFVGNRNNLFKNIAEDTSSGESKFARYRNVKLELPSEQYEGAAEFCREKAESLRKKAVDAAAKGAPIEEVERFKQNAENYERLADNVADSGLTTEQAIYYREHPKMATFMDIARTSNQAGLEGAKYGALIGGAISIITNAFSIAQEKKELDDSAIDIALDTGKAAVLGYGTAFAGSALKGGLQQSSNQSLRILSGTNAPALAVSICISLGTSVTRYVNGDITEGEFLTEVGEKGAGMLSSGMMAAIGQVAIPVPFLGAAVGGMIGYTLSSFFYQAALEASVSLELSRENLARVKEIETAARERIEEERTAFTNFISKEIPVLQAETQSFFDQINTVNEGIDFFAQSINKYATLLGSNLQFKTLDEFDEFMDSDQALRI